MIHINNKAGWKKQFTVAASVLRVKTGLKESSLKRAREELQQKGYISVQSRGGNQAPIYQLTSLSSILDHSTDDSANQTTTETTNQRMDQTTAPLNKQEKKRQNINKTRQQQLARSCSIKKTSENLLHTYKLSFRSGCLSSVMF
ncbi:hypothetical protein [Aquibacillus albus]|uniref:Uncharacterized protein n=1 Tax=Aquibacillus albus TaxID=1168171 RepID=A0ABS2N3H5_9BACI|nr:hypothetical protein [Aquibacillus albus]MBM7572682.1 hypothetical protein [Aquibacillus albus]